jgi:hypothetical protein
MGGTNEKLYKVFVDTGAITTLQSSGRNFVLLRSEARKRMIELASYGKLSLSAAAGSMVLTSKLIFYLS